MINFASEIVPNNIYIHYIMKKKNYLFVLDNGLEYQIKNAFGAVLCSRPSRNMAVSRCIELANEFGLSYLPKILHV